MANILGNVIGIGIMLKGTENTIQHCDTPTFDIEMRMVGQLIFTSYPTTKQSGEQDEHFQVGSSG